MNDNTEIMREGFVKKHFGNGFAVHILTIPDGHDSEPHDHPGDIAVRVDSGGYIEEVFAADGSSEFFARAPGDVFLIPAARIHRIVDLPAGECITSVVYGPHKQVTRFWRWRDGVAQSRCWSEGWRE